MGRIQDGENWHELSERSFYSGLLKDRNLARRLHRALEGFEGITCLWLADVFPELRPKARAPQYDRLVADARRSLARAPVGNDGLMLRRPAVPVIYARSGDSDWQRFKSGRARPYTTTSKLIQEFRHARSATPSLEGVLIKVLPDDAADHNPLDPPMITTTQLDAARAAGLAAVLLDRRYGVVSLTDAGEAALPIFAA
jgi:hypothetical protein